MRTLVLLRGLPASGKSTFIKENGLEHYTLSADELRLRYGSPVLTEDGKWDISPQLDGYIWNTLHQMLEFRMERGIFTVVDATHTDTNKMMNYKKLKEKYRYRIMMVDFSDVTEAEALKRNREREELDQVPEHVIRRMSREVQKQSIPGWIDVVKPEEFKEKVTFQPIDFSEWKKIHHIGDIHGCYSVLREFIPGALNSDELYIFTGDYVDRGVENAEVLDYLIKIMNKPNVILMEGNHDRYPFLWASGENVPTREFNKRTKEQLEWFGVKKKDVRRMYRKLRQAVHYTYGEKEVLVSHGGLSKPVEDLLYVSTEQLVKGVGGYETDIDQTFTRNVQAMNKEIYQVHGHRNMYGKPVINGHSFNLEGEVERGGHLRIVTLSKEGFEATELKNDVFSERFKKQVVSNEMPVKDYVEVLRGNEYIREADDNQGGVSSFNFTTQVFYNQIWNAQTTRARGLHIDTVNEEIVARGYDKFFNVDEREETKMDSLEITMKFPTVAYEKENGFLGLLGYHKAKGELYFASKASTGNRFAGMLKDQFKRLGVSMKEFKEWMSRENVTLALEVINPKKDPHLIDYEEPKLVLLDVIYNEIDFRKKEYDEVVLVAELFGLDVKKEAKTLANWEEFSEWMEEVTSEDPKVPTGSNVEGYVLEDANGDMVKVKLPFYSYWKSMRAIIDAYKSGLEFRHRIEGDEFAEAFMDWVEENVDPKGRESLLELRKEFLKE